MERIAAAEKTLDRELAKHPVFLQLERQTGVKKTRLVAGAAGALVGLFAMRFIASALVALVIFAYPAAMTVGAIEANNKADDVHWLAYWMVVTLVTTLEAVTGNWISFFIPFYPFVKLAFCVWLFLPQTRGATLVYQRVLRPLVAAYKSHPAYSRAVGEAARATEMAAKATGKAAAVAQEAARDAAKKAAADAIDSELAKKTN